MDQEGYKMNEPKELKTINIVLCILLVFLSPVFFFIFKEIIPKTRTHFLSYRFFVAETQWTIYRNELPKSAKDLRYYYYEGVMADKNGFHASFSQEDYEMMKEDRLATYHPGDPCTYNYDGVNKVYLDWGQMEEWKVDYVDQLIPKEKDDGHYYYLIYAMTDASSVYHYGAVLCNDETCEMVELSCRICY